MASSAASDDDHAKEEEEEEAPELVPFDTSSATTATPTAAAAPAAKGMVPVTIITGFLGAGKSTLLNYILTDPSHGRRIAVIENEFGKGLGIESAIAKDGTDGSDLGGIFVELANGCICCSVKSDLLATLEALVERKSKFDYIIIETSGMADPGPVASCLWVDEALESQLYLDGIVTVVDAKHITRHIDTRRQPPREANDANGPYHDADEPPHTEEAYRQICVADRLLLNKADLVPPDTLLRLERDLRALNGMAAIRRTEFSRVDLDFVLGLDCYGQVRRGGAAGLVPSLLQMPLGEQEEGGGGGSACCDKEEEGPCRHHHGEHEHEHTREVTTLALVEPGLEVDVDAVRRWLGALLWQEDDEEEDAAGHGGQPRRATEIYRMKGVLAVAGSAVVHILQAVHETFEVEASRSLTWGDGEGQPGQRECRVVVIGRGLQEEALRQGLLAAASRGGEGEG